MTALNSVCKFLEELAPIQLAEDWDNVGLLVGDPNMTIDRVMTCLTITPKSAAEAIDQNANLIVTHHPLPFRPLQKITTEKTATKLLWNLIKAEIAIYSPHTAFDSADSGINQSVCEQLGATNIQPLIASQTLQSIGSGRLGRFAIRKSLEQLLDDVKKFYGLRQVRFVGRLDSTVGSIASACGSGGSFLSAAISAKADVLLTGETDFHSCLEASARDIALILVGHFSSERFAVEMLANRLAQQYPNLEIWASKQESDPISCY